MKPGLSTQSDSRTERTLDRRLAFWLGLALFAFYALGSAGHQPRNDEDHYLSVAENFVADGKLMANGTRPGPDGKLQPYRAYAKFQLGQSLLEMPMTAVASLLDRASPFRMPLLNLLPNAECALIVIVLFLLARLPIERDEAEGEAAPLLSRRMAAALALATGAGTQLWPSASTHFADTSAGLFIFIALFCVVVFRVRKAGPGLLIAASCAAAFAIFCKMIFVLACPALAVYAAWAIRERMGAGEKFSAGRIAGIAVLAALPFALAGAGQLWFNHLRFGSIWNGGYSEGRDLDFGFSNPILVGIYGILFSSGRSFFLYSPMCLLALWGWRDFLRWRRAEAALVAGLALPILLVYAKWWAWYGSWEWGCRFHLFMIPLWMWLSTPFWRRLKQIEPSVWLRRLRHGSLALLAGVSLYVQILGVLVNPMLDWNLVYVVPALELPEYKKGVWDTRDDAPLVHYLPQFSPPAVHAWLIWATLDRDRFSEKALASRSPFARFNPKWAPIDVRPFLGFDPWILTIWDQAPQQRAAAAGAIAILLALLVLGLSQVFALIRIRARAESQ